MEIKKVTTKEELKKLYDCSAMTYEGFDENDIDKIVEHFKEKGYLKDGFEVYVTKGEKMNEICDLTGSNAYPSDLTIVSFVGFTGLALMVDGRWMDDIIDNNADREVSHPFKENFYEEEEDDYYDDYEDDDYYDDEEDERYDSGYYYDPEEDDYNDDNEEDDDY